MTILVLGINHKTATVALREKVAFSEDKRLSALNQIEQLKLAQSAVILSTCNRTEVYLHNKFIQPEQTAAWIDECAAWFAAIHQIQLADLQDCLYFYQNQQAVTHLMRVACGLDSLILGEPQILGQVKQAYQLAEEYYQTSHQLGESAVISSELSRLFQRTFSTAKRVRTETNIGESAVSVAYAACSLARQIFESLHELTILLVGAGETIELVARHLLRHGVQKLMIANRTRARAEALVEKLELPSIDVLPLPELQNGLNQADIIISSTGSPTTLISYDMMKQAQVQRHYRPVLIVDIAVPRDVEESIVKLDSVYHYTVDDLQNIISHNLSERKKASELAQGIIDEECQAFFEWLKVHQASNLIRAYRESADQIRRELLEKAQFSLSQGESADKILEEFSTKLMNKLLHSPTRVMQTMVKQSDSQGLQHFLSVIEK